MILAMKVLNVFFWALLCSMAALGLASGIGMDGQGVIDHPVAFVGAGLLALTSGGVALVAFRTVIKGSHLPGEHGGIVPGLTYCKYCGLLIAADGRPDLKAGYKPCLSVRLTSRRGRLGLKQLPMTATERAAYPEWGPW